MRAKAAKLNAARWTFYTFISMLVTWFIGVFIVVTIMLVRDPKLRTMLLSQSQDKQRITEYLSSKNLLVPQLFMLFCMVGGYLFVRYLMAKKGEMMGENNEG